MLFLAPLAYLVDLFVGDPDWITHPVVLQGRGIAYLEKKLNRPQYSRRCLMFLGALVVLLIVGGAFMITGLLVALAGKIHPIAGGLIAIWLTSTAIAQKGLAQASVPITKALKGKDLLLARKLTGQIVGRDTTDLDEHELVRATIETVAENTVDAITAPLFYAILGGAPYVMAYRAINTLDSMLGYKNERYIYFGWAAARLDDLANYIPARLSGLVLPLAVALCGLNVSDSIAVMKRDAKKHPSPNSGILEAGFAGAMGITLGGENIYGGQISSRALMGNTKRPLKTEDILVAVRLMKMVSALFLVLFYSFFFFILFGFILHFWR